MFKHLRAFSSLLVLSTLVVGCEDQSSETELDVQLDQVSLKTPGDNTFNFIPCPKGDPNCIPIGGPGGTSIYPSDLLPFDGGYTLTLAYGEGSAGQIRLYQLDLEGNLVTEGGIGLASGVVMGAGAPALGGDGNHLMSVFAAQGERGVQLKSIKIAEGARTFEPRVVASLQGVVGDADLSFGGSEYLLQFSSDVGGDFDLVGLHLNRDGEASELSPLMLAGGEGDQLGGASTFDGRTHFAVFEDMAAVESSDIKGVYLSERQPEPTSFVVDNSAGMQLAPAITSAGATVARVWEDHSRGQSDVKANFSSLGSSNFVVAGGEEEQSAPAVAASSVDVGVAYVVDGSSIHFRVLGQLDGRLLTDRVLTSEQQVIGGPRVSFDGSRYIVMWLVRVENVVQVQGQFIEL